MADKNNFRFTYKGTVDAFKATNLPAEYANEVVHITGDAYGNGRAIYGNGEYYANGDAMSERGWRIMRLNGSDLYWNKIASISQETITSGGRDAWIEVEVNGDTNYPCACRFVIQITQYLNTAISIAVVGGASSIARTGGTPPTPYVTVDADHNVWLKIDNAQWDMYAAIRPLKQDQFGTISILGKAVNDNGHASNFEAQVDAPASTYLEGYGGLRYVIESGTYTLTGAIIDATAKDAEKLGGVTASNYVQSTALKTINGKSLVGSGDITIHEGPYTIQSLDIIELATGASFGNEIEYIKQAITSGINIEIYTGNGYGKACAIYQELDDFVYLSFVRMSTIIYMEVNLSTGEIESYYET